MKSASTVARTFSLDSFVPKRMGSELIRERDSALKHVEAVDLINECLRARNARLQETIKVLKKTSKAGIKLKTLAVEECDACDDMPGLDFSSESSDDSDDESVSSNEEIVNQPATVESVIDGPNRHAMINSLLRAHETEGTVDVAKPKTFSDWRWGSCKSSVLIPMRFDIC